MLWMRPARMRARQHRLQPHDPQQSFDARVVDRMAQGVKSVGHPLHAIKRPLQVQPIDQAHQPQRALRARAPTRSSTSNAPILPTHTAVRSTTHWVRLGSILVGPPEVRSQLFLSHSTFILSRPIS